MTDEGAGRPRADVVVLDRFPFSQASLTDYADCPRRFQLRYVLEQEWPAVESEPLLERERLADLGRRFHRLAQQHVVGLPVERLTRAAEADPDLARWWGNFLKLADGGWKPEVDRPSLPPHRRAEAAISIPLGAHRLVAKFDLLATGDGRAVIVDWKTERRRPDRSELMQRLQTRVYRCVLAKTESSIAPESMQMVYWFAEHPWDPEILAYDARQFASDENDLRGMIDEITRRAEAIWPLTPDARKCRFCTYRSLCERGVAAGVDDSDAVESDTDVDWETIGEIAY